MNAFTARMYILAGELQTREVTQSIFCLSHTTFILSYINRGDDIKKNYFLKSCGRDNLRPTEF